MRLEAFPRSRPARTRLVAALGLLATWAGPVFARPVLHELITPDPAEDLQLSATTPDGRLPAAVDTPAGPVPAPDPGRSPASDQHAYGGGAARTGAEARYAIDTNTTRPDTVSYHEPFTPSIAPFKRLRAYDAVDEGFALVLAAASQRLVDVSPGGIATSEDDQFYADLVVDLLGDEPVLVPTVGPGTRLLGLTVEPRREGIRLRRDGADQWFASGPRAERVRLVLQLAVPRSVFAAHLADVSWDRLAPVLPPVPAEVRALGARVAGELGITRQQGPKAVLERLVAHFRSFAPSSDRPRASGGGALYQELALSRKGVCRHRSYAFVVTALAPGLPARMVHNEAHAWVEVFGGVHWHRVDLGGAAGLMSLDADPSVPEHTPPQDPLAWPEGSESGAEMLQRSRGGGPPSAPGAATPSAQAPGGSGAPAPDAPPPATAATPLGPPEAAPPPHTDDRPPARIEQVRVEQRQLRRGAPLSVSGRLTGAGTACSGARVDVGLRAPGLPLVPIGSLGAGEDGRFSGSVTLPLGLALGEYDVVLSTPGSPRCGAGRSESP